MTTPSSEPKGRPDLGIWIKLPILESIEMAKIAGFDFVVIDLEHSPITTATASSQLAMAAALGLRAFVRIPLSAGADLQRLLDAGAAGVFVPMVESVADAEAAVRACRFPPLGRRGAGPTSRAGRWGAKPLGEYLDDGAAHLTLVLQLESSSAMLSAQAIGAQPGVDAVFFGPTDLAVSMGEAPGSAVVQQVVTVTEDTARQDGTVFGTATRPPSAGDLADFAGRGYSFLVVANDASLLLDGACAVVQSAV
jgi:2-keto-3-deoxy-L-rhamnonate aldolase RhmA